MSLNTYITETTVDPSASGPLDGQTVAIKDNISTEGVRTTCGSDMLESYVPPYNATVVERVLDAGGEIVGKTNMDEFGMGTTTESSAFGATKNPIDADRVPGGSSGGSAVAVATGDADVALGSDTGGSIRCPAAFCGVVGIKPTYGLVSRYGLIAYANSLEQIGPFGRTVEDAAGLLDVIAGSDDRDGTTRSIDAVGTYADAALNPSLEGLSIGVPSQLLDGVDDIVEAGFERARSRLEAAGVSFKSISLPSIEHAIQAYYVIAMSEASSNLARFDGVRYGHSGGFDGNWNEVFSQARSEGFGAEVKRRILLGTYALSAGYHDRYYKKAQDARAWVKQDFDSAFEQVDMVASPTMPVVPFELGETIDDPMQMYLADANTVPVNLADLPAISVPVGAPETDLPVGFQLIGPAFSEPDLIKAAAGLESIHSS